MLPDKSLMTFVPCPRTGEPDDFAPAADGPAAEDVTGATLFVDGGEIHFPDVATGG